MSLQPVYLRPSNGMFALSQALLIPNVARTFTALVLTPGQYSRQICLSQTREFYGTITVQVRECTALKAACIWLCAAPGGVEFAVSCGNLAAPCFQLQGGVSGARLWVGGLHSQQEGIKLEISPGTSIVDTEVMHFGVCNQINDCIHVSAGPGAALQVRGPRQRSAAGRAGQMLDAACLGLSDRPCWRVQDVVVRGNFALETKWNIVVFRGSAPSIAGVVAFVWQASTGGGETVCHTRGKRLVYQPAPPVGPQGRRTDSLRAGRR
jgi:hypothetical protein